MTVPIAGIRLKPFGKSQSAIVPIPRGTIAIFAIGTDQLVTLTNEDAVSVLNRCVVTPSCCSITRFSVGHRGEVVNGGSSSRLCIRVFSTIKLKDIVTKTRALRSIPGIALHNQSKLSFSSPSLIDIKRVITNVPYRDVLQTHGASPDLDAIINVVHDLNVVNLSPPSQGSQRESVEFVGQPNNATAVADREVGNTAGVIVVVATPVVVESGISSFFNQTFHVCFI